MNADLETYMRVHLDACYTAYIRARETTGEIPSDDLIRNYVRKQMYGVLGYYDALTDSGIQTGIDRISIRKMFNATRDILLTFAGHKI